MVERFLGKEEVGSSILLLGSRKEMNRQVKNERDDSVGMYRVQEA